MKFNARSPGKIHFPSQTHSAGSCSLFAAVFHFACYPTAGPGCGLFLSECPSPDTVRHRSATDLATPAALRRLRALRAHSQGRRQSSRSLDPLVTVSISKAEKHLASGAAAMTTACVSAGLSLCGECRETKNKKRRGKMLYPVLDFKAVAKGLETVWVSCHEVSHC